MSVSLSIATKVEMRTSVSHRKLVKSHTYNILCIKVPTYKLVPFVHYCVIIRFFFRNTSNTIGGTVHPCYFIIKRPPHVIIERSPLYLFIHDVRVELFPAPFRVPELVWCETSVRCGGGGNISRTTRHPVAGPIRPYCVRPSCGARLARVQPLLPVALPLSSRRSGSRRWSYVIPCKKDLFTRPKKRHRVISRTHRPKLRAQPYKSRGRPEKSDLVKNVLTLNSRGKDI